MVGSFDFRLLGTLEVLRESEPIAIRGRKPRALLAYLLLHANETVPRERLIDALWGEDPPPTASNALQVHVHALRRALGHERIGTRGTGYVLHIRDGELDVGSFEKLVRRGADALKARDSAGAQTLLDEALALWRGEPLADLTGEPFVADEVGRLEELRVTALEFRAEADLALGNAGAVVDELEAPIREHPFRERLRELYMLALYRAGRQADALAAYVDARRALVDELGIEPGRNLQDLERRILQQDPTLDGGPAARVRPALPVPATDLVGRDLELAATTALVRRADVRLLTLCGPGGTGKTRLALAIAQELAAGFRDGVAFVDLAPIEDPELVPAAVASMLGLAERSLVPVTDLLADALRERAMLLVLDNFEQVIDAAPFVSRLLASAPELRVVATSRAPLRIAGERAYMVPPLTLPAETAPADALARNDAVRLFVARAQDATSTFELTPQNAAPIAAICRSVDGLPLAIELAAARTPLFPPEVMRERLGSQLDLLAGGRRDAPERHRTLRATLDWSYRLLAESERRLLSRIAVFAGGCSFAAAEAVCEADSESLAVLVDNSLVRTFDSRLGLLETVRQYALERLAESGEEEAVRLAHASFLLALAESARSNVHNLRALRTLDVEHDNFRAAIAFANETGRSELHLRLCTALWSFWYTRGFLSEARSQFESALAAGAVEPALRAAGLRAAAVIAWAQGDLDASASFVDESRDLYRELGDRDGLVTALITSGLVAQDRGDLAAAQRFHEESRELAQALEQPAREGAALANLGDVALLNGDTEQARSLYLESRSLCKRAGDEQGVAIATMFLGVSALRGEGDRAEARELFCASLESFVELGFTERVVSSLVGLGAAIAADEPELAARMLGGAEALRTAIGGRTERWWEGAVIEQATRTIGDRLGDRLETELAGGAAAPDETIREALAAVAPVHTSEGRVDGTFA